MKRRRTFKLPRPVAGEPEVNVTPLVDVVLVLLIIFMVVTPLVERELKVATPPMEQVDQPQAIPEQQVMLAVRADGTLLINDEVVPAAELKGRLERVLAARADKLLFFQADDAASYEVAVAALDDAKAAGAKTIGMLTEPLPEAPAEPTEPGPPPPEPPAPPAPPASP